VTNSPQAGGRLRAYLEFIAAVIYYFLARSMARHAAASLANQMWYPLAEQAFLGFVLILGFALFGQLFDHQKNPVAEQGLPLRPGWSYEAGMGLAVGWGIALACVLPLAVSGGIAIVLSTQWSSWAWLLMDALFFALMALAEEVAFRGYGFQRFRGVVGSAGATVGFAAFYAIVQALQPGSSHLSIAISVLFGVVVSAAYLRTRALWLSWGLNFGWKASRALVFGLAVSGVSSHSSVVEGDPMGPFWLTGGGYGLDGSWVAFFVLLAALPVVYRVTRELDFRYNAPVIIPGGIPVDLDAAGRRQHDSAMGPAEPAAPVFVQILPAAPTASNQAEKTSGAGPQEPR
jgi:membrane protease YdiL (CAAX protease family)